MLLVPHCSLSFGSEGLTIGINWVVASLLCTWRRAFSFYGIIFTPNHFLYCHCVDYDQKLYQLHHTFLYSRASKKALVCFFAAWQTNGVRSKAETRLAWRRWWLRYLRCCFFHWTSFLSTQPFFQHFPRLLFALSAGQLVSPELFLMKAMHIYWPASVALFRSCTVRIERLPRTFLQLLGIRLFPGYIFRCIL